MYNVQNRGNSDDSNGAAISLPPLWHCTAELRWEIDALHHQLVDALRVSAPIMNTLAQHQLRVAHWCTPTRCHVGHPGGNHGDNICIHAVANRTQNLGVKTGGDKKWPMSR